MNWGDWFLGAGTVLYFGAAVSYYLQGQFPWALTYICYVGANAGLIWSAHWRVNQ